MNNCFNTSNAVIGSREVEPLFMAVDGVSIFVIRKSERSPMLSFPVSHSHFPPTFAQMGWLTECVEKMELCLFKSQSQNISSGYYFSFTWPDGSDDGGNIVGSDNMIQPGTSHSAER